MFESTGKLIYDPHARIKQAPNWLILRTDEEILRYYQHWIKKELALDLGGIRRAPIKFETTVWGYTQSAFVEKAPRREHKVHVFQQSVPH